MPIVYPLICEIDSAQANYIAIEFYKAITTITINLLTHLCTQTFYTFFIHIKSMHSQCIIVQFIICGPKQLNVSVILSHGQILGWTKIVLKNLHQELGELLIYKGSPLILIL